MIPTMGRRDRVDSTRPREPAAASTRLCLAIGLAAAVFACQKPSESQQVADRFMQLYYGQANLAEAVVLSTGAAKERLEREIRAIVGVAPDTGANKPTVTFSLISSTSPSSNMAIYSYEVVPHTADVGTLVATLDIALDGGRWLVSSLSEQHSTP